MEAQSKEFGDLAAATVAAQRKGLAALKADTDDTLAGALSAGGLLAAAALLAGLLSAWVVGRGITRPVRAMTAIMSRLASGDTAITVPALRHRDEVGAMARAVEVFREAAIAKRRMEEEQAQAEEAQRAQEAEQRRHEAAILAEVAQVTRDAAAGKLDERIDLADKDGFFRQLCESLNALLTQTGAALAEVEAALGALAAGDLSHRISSRREGVFGRLGENVNATVQHLCEVVARIDQGSAHILTAAREVAGGSTDLSERTERQAANLQETAAAMEELAATVHGNAETVHNATTLAGQARILAASGGDKAGQAVAWMEKIATSSQRIEDIIALLDDVTFQTNLLSLNASVEAARAGQAGAGFAVVAQEVRSLAQRSAAASRE
ncbi:MAG: HAMP domain-containing protein, partial [Rhodospirillales bacterium]|nr:HAMP domain-containing protein [Rhodospirillales bacterium]